MNKSSNLCIGTCNKPRLHGYTNSYLQLIERLYPRSEDKFVHVQSKRWLPSLWENKGSKDNQKHLWVSRSYAHTETILERTLATVDQARTSIMKTLNYKPIYLLTKVRRTLYIMVGIKPLFETSHTLNLGPNDKEFCSL